MIWWLLGALAVGLSLGLLGSGGSVLTVPVLVYLVGQPEKVAIAGSLAIVGAVALAGALAAARQRRIDWRSVALFGLPGMAGTWGGALVARWVPGAVQLAVFAVVMLVASVLMLRPPLARRGAGGDDGDGGPAVSAAPPRRAPLKVAADGLAVGAMTGFVGVGGGFLIVPALVLLGGLPIHLAVGTSLTIIALNAGTGFVGYLGTLAELDLALDWRVIGIFTALGVVGSLIGARIGRRLPQDRLRRAFGWFLVAVGTLILGRSLPVEDAMIEFLSRPWPWWVAGPLIGLMVPLLLVVGGKAFGISSSLRHVCAATLPARYDFFRYDWRREGSWNLVFALGIVVGGVIAGTLLASPHPEIAISPQVRAELAALGIEDFAGMVPDDLVGWRALGTLPGLLVVVGGGFLVGFGARWAGGCTSGHAVTGMSNLQLPSLIAVVAFFAGGLAMAWFGLPLVLGAGG